VRECQSNYPDHLEPNGNSRLGDQGIAGRTNRKGCSEAKAVAEGRHEGRAQIVEMRKEGSQESRQKSAHGLAERG
jgi:hypothetical protein